MLRIKDGETDFDQNFSIDIEDYQFPAEFNRLFVYDSKIYTTIPSRAVSYYGGTQHGVSYWSDVWYWSEIAATTKKAKRLNIPRSEEHTSEPKLLMLISYDVLFFKTKKK